MTIQSIFLVGNFHPGNMEASYQRAFNSIGIRTHIFERDKFEFKLSWLLRNRITHRLTIQSKAVRDIASRAFNRCLENAVLESKVSTLLMDKGEFVMERTYRSLRRKGVRIACYFPDNPFPPYSCHRPETLPAARETDLYLTWSERLVKKLSDAGVPNPVFLPFAWDSEVFPYQGSHPQGVWPGALFLGGWDKEREEFLEELACSVQLRIYGPLWGSRTRRGSRVRRSWQGSDLRLGAAARMIRESAVCLNPLRTQHVIDGSPDGLIMRHFEVPGAGGFLISTRASGATTLFPEGETGEYFSSVPECVEKVKFYIAHEAARHRLVNAAHAEVAARHQYTDRARQILRLMSECR